MGDAEFLSSIDQAKALAVKYSVPLIDTLLIGLNSQGAAFPDMRSDRLRFKLHMDKHPFFLALTNNKNSSFKYKKGELFISQEKIGHISDIEEDSCDSTYFRRFKNIKEQKIGTAITINSNSRSQCRGCKFCGSYSLKEKDVEENDLTSKSKLRRKIDSLLLECGRQDLSFVYAMGIVTGCFSGEKETLEHILMLSEVLERNILLQEP